MIYGARRSGVVFLLALLMLPTLARAHDVMAPLKGEQKAHTAYERLFLLLPSAAEAASTITLRGNSRVIKANGYPEHQPGSFPNAGNPHQISRKNYNLSVSANPVKGSPKPLNRTPFGITINGVLLDPATAEFWQNDRRSGWNYEAFGGACRLGLDRHNAHVQPNGTYHYHGLPTGLLDKFRYKQQPALIGYAADGFAVYGPYGYKDAANAGSGMKKLAPGYALKSGTRNSGPGGRYDGKFTKDYAYRAGLGDLDECNGRSGVTPEYPQGSYYYVISDSFPYIPRCLRGEADVSFSRLKGGPGGGRMRPPRPGRAGPEAGGPPPPPGVRGGGSGSGRPSPCRM